MAGGPRNRHAQKPMPGAAPDVYTACGYLNAYSDVGCLRLMECSQNSAPMYRTTPNLKNAGNQEYILTLASPVSAAMESDILSSAVNWGNANIPAPGYFIYDINFVPNHPVGASQTLIQIQVTYVKCL